MSHRDQLAVRSALMYVAVAVAPDKFLSDGELERIADLLARRFPDVLPDEDAHDAIALALHELPASEVDQAALINRTAAELKHMLQPDQRKAVLQDLVSIARADGIVLDLERSFIDSLAEEWEVAAPDTSQPVERDVTGTEPWTALHDLTLIYLILAHGTDNELSKNEVDLMIRKLGEWLPDLHASRIRDILRSAMNRYAEGLDDASVQRAIRSVKDAMPAEQRMAALHDLVQIANADGVFLDVEEDLINNLQSEWEVDPYANYGRHGEKG